MRKQKEIGLDFQIDKLTNSIENVVTGDNFRTEISIMTDRDLKMVSKKNGQLIDHYEKTLGAFHVGGRVMIIETHSALKLIKKYF